MKDALRWSSLENLILLLGLLLCQLHLGDVLQHWKESKQRCTVTGSGFSGKYYLAITRTESTGQRAKRSQSRTSQTVMLESAEPVTILSSLALACRAHTLSWWASSVLTHSLVLMVHSFTKPSEPLRSVRTVARDEWPCRDVLSNTTWRSRMKGTCLFILQKWEQIKRRKITWQIWHSKLNTNLTKTIWSGSMNEVICCLLFAFTTTKQQTTAATI